MAVTVESTLATRPVLQRARCFNRRHIRCWYLTAGLFIDTVTVKSIEIQFRKVEDDVSKKVSILS